MLPLPIVEALLSMPPVYNVPGLTLSNDELLCEKTVALLISLPCCVCVLVSLQMLILMAHTSFCNILYSICQSKLELVYEDMKTPLTMHGIF